MAVRLEVFENLAALSDAAAAHFFRLAHDAVARNGAFRVALAGGETPRAAYERMAATWRDALGGPTSWDEIHLFWGDERMVSPDDPRSNFGMARTTLLSHVPIPKENVHPIPVNGEDPAGAAARYEETLRVAFPRDGKEFPHFDLILLGMGADGHTASLFPASPALGETARIAAATRHPETGESRVTLTLPVLNHAAAVIVIVSGVAKSAMLERVVRGTGRPAGGPLLPVERLQPATGTLLWLADANAAPWTRSESRPE